MVLGWRKVTVDLDNLKDEIKKAPLQAMKDGADIVVRDAQRLCVDPRVTPTIRRTDEMKSRKKGNPMIQVRAGDSTTLVGATEKFQLARLIEYGTKGKRTPPPQLAQPFLRPAWRDNRKKIEANMRKAIREAIKKANSHGS